MEKTNVRVLLVEDDEEDFLLTRKILSKNGCASFEVAWARSYDAALLELRKPYDVCLVDYRLGADTGLALIHSALAAGFLGPMILLTGRGDYEVDVEAMKAGAADYLVKDEITPQLMERVIRHAIERKSAEAALCKSEEQLRQSQKMEAIGSLAGGIAHDFNNILSVILSYSELLTRGLPPGDPMRADLDEISASGWRAADLTRQLLAFSRQQVLRPAIVDLNEILARADKMLQRVIGADVELATRTAAGLDKVLVDPGQMDQVIMNLVVNARDAMPKGGKLTIETSNVVLTEKDALDHAGVKPGPHVMLTISDTGIGMDKETMARVFEPFFTTKEVGKGTGLGLSTVFGIVRQSEGSIWASSEPGKGTSFHTCFPALSASVSEVPVTPEAAIDTGTLHGSETVLVVEDEDRVRVVVCAILRKYGYTVLDARSGGDALIVCEQHRGKIDLLLTDVVMARMSGPELATRLAVVRPEMKVLFMSGYAAVSMPRTVGRAAYPPLLQKPFIPETLARHVREALALGIVTGDVRGGAAGGSISSGAAA